MNKIFTLLALAASAATMNAQDYTFEVDPASGRVTELETVTVTFSEFIDIDVYGDQFRITRDESEIEGVKVKKTAYTSNRFTVTFPETMTAPGEYVILMEAGSIEGYTEGAPGEDWECSSLEKDLRITYTIEAAEGDLDFSYNATPESEAMLPELPKVELTFPALLTVEADKSGASVEVNGTALTEDAFTVSGDGNRITLEFTPAITAGKIDIKFAAGSISGTTADGAGATRQKISLSYTVAAPVVYDLGLALSSPTKPNVDGEISAEKQLDAFFFAANVPGLVPDDDDQVINAKITMVNGDFERTAHLSKAMGLDIKNYSYFSANFGAPSYNGEYVITIEKGAFGNDVWAENHEFGRSNDVIELHFTLVDGLEASVFDIKPLEVLPAEGKVSDKDLKSVTVGFPDGVKIKSIARASLAGVDVTSYMEFAEFKANGDGTFTAEFANLPTERGEYLLNIDAGQFGDADYIAGNGGHANARIELRYTVDNLTAVGSIEDADADADVYTVTGVRLGNDLRSLPAGLYIVGGRKLVIRK